MLPKKWCIKNPDRSTLRKFCEKYINNNRNYTFDSVGSYYYFRDIITETVSVYKKEEYVELTISDLERLTMEESQPLLIF